MLVWNSVYFDQNRRVLIPTCIISSDQSCTNVNLTNSYTERFCVAEVTKPEMSYFVFENPKWLRYAVRAQFPQKESVSWCIASRLQSFLGNNCLSSSFGDEEPVGYLAV